MRPNPSEDPDLLAGASVALRFASLSLLHPPSLRPLETEICGVDHVVRAAKTLGIAGEVWGGAGDTYGGELRARLAPAARMISMANMRKAVVACEVLECLQTGGVDALVFKGLGISAQTRVDPALRRSSDVDVLVKPTDLRKAYDLLIRAGGVRNLHFPVPDRSRRFAAYRHLRHELNIRFRGVNIDLHWQLGTDRRLLPSTDEALEYGTEVSVSGRSVQTLSIGDALIHSVLHWRQDGYRSLKQVLDIHELVQLAQASDVPVSRWRSARISKSVAMACWIVRDPQVLTSTRAPAGVSSMEWRRLRAGLGSRAAQSQLTVRALSLVGQLRTSVTLRDRAMIPARAAIGPIIRRFPPSQPDEELG